MPPCTTTNKRQHQSPTGHTLEISDAGTASFRARHAIRAGERIEVVYGSVETHTNARLLQQYGFVTDDGVRHETVTYRHVPRDRTKSRSFGDRIYLLSMLDGFDDKGTRTFRLSPVEESDDDDDSFHTTFPAALFLAATLDDCSDEEALAVDNAVQQGGDVTWQMIGTSVSHRVQTIVWRRFAKRFRRRLRLMLQDEGSSAVARVDTADLVACSIRDDELLLVCIDAYLSILPKTPDSLASSMSSCGAPPSADTPAHCSGDNAAPVTALFASHLFVPEDADDDAPPAEDREVDWNVFKLGGVPEYGTVAAHVKTAREYRSVVVVRLGLMHALRGQLQHALRMANDDDSDDDGHGARAAADWQRQDQEL
jgi:hypothetical protein